MKAQIILFASVAFTLVGCNSFSSIHNTLFSKAVLFSPNSSGTSTLPAVKLNILSSPSSGTVGVSLSPTLQIEALDTNGNSTSNVDGTVSVQLAANPTHSSLGGVLTASFINGVATFSDLNLTASGSGYTLLLNSGTLPSLQTNSFSVVPGGSTRQTYYLSATGNDSNNGLSMNSPWLTPNHSLNCGDVILAQPSNAYSYTNFGGGLWGNVSCPFGNNVAWLKCATFDGCKMLIPAGIQTFGMNVSASYWGVQGWEISMLGTDANDLTCFNASPPNNNAGIHHIIFANNVANICPLGGFGMGPWYPGTASVDYLAVVGNISYAAAGANTGCGSGISLYRPMQSDSLPGTHMYVAGNFSYATANPPNCWDGNGIILDTFDLRGESVATSYSAQAVIENNISVSNAGVGVRVEYNNGGPGPNHSTVYVRHNTTWGNSTDSYQSGSPDCGEFQIYETETTNLSMNLGETTQNNCYGFAWGNPDPVYMAKEVDNTNTIANNWGYGQWGNESISMSVSGFTFDPSNILTTDPQFLSPAAPAAPTCALSSNTVACMGSVIANFTPMAIGASAYGYQSPTTQPKYDPLFPKWLCQSDLPPGLISMACVDSGT